MAQKTSFYMNEELEKVLKKYIKRYGSLSKAISTVAFCIDSMYRIERSALRSIFTSDEINLMLNNALSTHYTPQGILNHILHDTEDEAYENFDYFKVDRNEIISKLKKLTVSQQYALVDWLIEMRGSEPAEAEG
jgi:hypothetical protein